MSGAPPGKGSKIERERELQTINTKKQDPVSYKRDPPSKPKRMAPPGPPPLSEQNPSTIEQNEEIRKRQINASKQKAIQKKPKGPKPKTKVRVKLSKDNRRRINIAEVGEPPIYLTDSDTNEDDPTINNNGDSSSEQEIIEYVEENEEKDDIYEVISNPKLRIIEEEMRIRRQKQQDRYDYYNRLRDEQVRRAEEARRLKIQQQITAAQEEQRRGEMINRMAREELIQEYRSLPNCVVQ
jgi:hypothetical protein